MVGVSKLYCGAVEAGDVLRYGRRAKDLPSHLLQFSADKKPVVVWNCTKRCNLKCLHCYAQATATRAPDELTHAEGLALLQDFKDFGVPVVLFSGGEPLMREDLSDLVEWTVKNGMRAVISTNGTLITKMVARRLQDLGLSYVGISLDGTERTHDHFRGQAGSFAAAMAGVRNCQEAGLKVGLRFTVSRLNFEEVPAIFDLVEEYDIPRICFYHLVYAGGYGADGKHGANYMQTAAASVAGMSAMGVLVQAMVWMGMTEPPTWQLVLYMLCIGMFGAGVGMLYTPILVDRMQLTYPSGYAVASILRALTDPSVLRAAVTKLGSGIVLGIGGGLAATKVALLGAIELSASTLGAGMVVGARIGVPAIVSGLVGTALVPWFVAIGWLEPGDPFRKITFLFALGAIMGAAVIDLGVIFAEAVQRFGKSRPVAATQAEWQRTNTLRLVAWIVAWGCGILVTGSALLDASLAYLLFALALVFVFALVNGISVGISDSNPISSAFVVSVVLMAALGLRDPVVGLMAGTVLLVSTSVACDMQQDRSTGWRLNTNRVVQFRYQVAGILVGALLAVGFAKIFMAAYPVLRLDQTVMKAGEQPAEWSAAMTYKFVGILRSLTDDKPHQRTAIWIGVGIGFAIELARKMLKRSARYRAFVARGRAGFVTDFVVDAIVLPSPYAASFGGFVNLHTSLWFGAGGIVSSFINTVSTKRRTAAPSALPADMSATALFGGGLIAGDALAALGIGIAGLVATLASG